MMRYLMITVFALMLCVNAVYAENLGIELGNILNGETKQVGTVCDVFVPRKDLVSVMNGFVIQPQLGVGLKVSFVGNSKKHRVIEGKIALLEEEVTHVINFLKSNGFDIAAVHSHYLFENPKLVFVYFEKVGRSEQIATQLRQLADQVGNFGLEAGDQLSQLDAATLNDTLNLNGEIKSGGVFVATFKRKFQVKDKGEAECQIAMAGTMENALVVGEIAVKVKEMQKLIKALLNQGLIVSAICNDEFAEKPKVSYIHFELGGLPAITLAQAVRTALNSIKIENE